MLSSTNINTWRVLIVDDELDNLRLTDTILSFKGARVSCVEGGAEALEALDTFKPNVILLDLSMPQMDGWEVHRQIRAVSSYDHIPVIALTAQAMSLDAERVRQAGFNGYISKPFRVDDFIKKIRESIEAFANQS